MTENEKYEIAVLADDLETKRLRFQMHQMLNTAGKTAEELTKMNIEYRIAETEMLEAKAKLSKAQFRVMQRS